MKYKLISIVLVMICTTIAFAEESIAIALKVKGDVELMRKEQVSKTKTGEELVNKDELESKEDSFAALKFIDGSSVVKLFPNSILTINAFKEDGKLNKKNFLQFGELWAKVVKKTGDFEIDTPTTVVSVKGTELFVTVNEKGETDLYTFDGEVHIRNKVDENEAIVTEGQKAHSKGEGEIIVSPIKKGDISEEQQDLIESGVSNVLEIELENDEGEKRTIKIEFE
ncbi:MAG: FecR domain-containing protein [Candidatus Cloacimonetes bacterium]|nr:FecR domain-containing protein [Candidatus Cloacimonadota bacterium]